jgi:hypothetical protein
MKSICWLGHLGNLMSCYLRRTMRSASGTSDPVAEGAVFIRLPDTAASLSSSFAMIRKMPLAVTGGDPAYLY